MQKLKIRDIRFSCTYFNAVVKNSVSDMLSNIGHNYLSKIKYQFEVTKTNILLFNVSNQDKDPYSNSGPRFRLGDGEFDNIGSAVIFLSENHFLSLGDEGKRQYLADHIHKIITNYAKHFNEDTKLLEEAYTKLLQKDGFYVKCLTPEISQNKKYSCWLESIINYKNVDYRICLKEMGTGIVSNYFLTNKPERDSEALKKMDIIELLKTPRLFESEGWNDKPEFKVRWGKYGNEVYLFNAQTKEIKKCIEDIEAPF